MGSSSATDFIIKLDVPFRVREGGGFRVTRVTIPATYHTIVFGINDAIDTDLGSVTLTPGRYSGEQLATEVEAALSFVDATFTCVWSETGAGFTIARGAGAFVLEWNTGASASTSAAHALGWDSTADTASAASHSSPFAPTLGEPLSFIVASDALTAGGPAGLVSGHRGSSLLQVVQNASPSFGGLLHWNAIRGDGRRTGIIPFRTDGKGIRLATVDFKVFYYDDRGVVRPIDLNGGCPEIELELWGVE